MKCDELKSVYIDRTGDWVRSGNDTGKFYLKSEVDAVITELKAKLEDAKATHYAESVDAGMRERRLKRALYKACANWARSERYTEATWHGDEHREELWAEVEDKCLKKAEEYK